MSAELSEVRRRAWETRRAKYGAQGHAGSYGRGPRPVPTSLDVIECEEGYPTEASISAFGRMVLGRATAAQFLLRTFPALCDEISSCSCAIESATDHIGRPVKRISFSTGGWSGAEDLIDAMLHHFWIKHFHTEWRRGGHFVFEVPQ